MAPNQFSAGDWLLKKARKLEVELSRPTDLTRGRDWINLGYKAGVDLGKLIKLANELRDEKNFSKEMVFEVVDNIDNSKKAIEKLKSVLRKK